MARGRMRPAQQHGLAGFDTVAGQPTMQAILAVGDLPAGALPVGAVGVGLVPPGDHSQQDRVGVTRARHEGEVFTALPNFGRRMRKVEDSDRPRFRHPARAFVGNTGVFRALARPHEPEPDVARLCCTPYTWRGQTRVLPPGAVHGGIYEPGDGGPGGARTHGPKIKSLVLYQLSYRPAGAPPSRQRAFRQIGTQIGRTRPCWCRSLPAGPRGQLALRRS